MVLENILLVQINEVVVMSIDALKEEISQLRFISTFIGCVAVAAISLLLKDLYILSWTITIVSATLIIGGVISLVITSQIIYSKINLMKKPNSD